MSISSHMGMIILVIVGYATILGVITIAFFETRRKDTTAPKLPAQSAEKPPEKKK